MWVSYINIMESKQNKNQLLFSFIKQEAYFTVNYKLVKHIGINPSIFFGEICNEFKYYYEKNILIDNDWFFATTDKIKNRIGFSKFLQSNCIKILQDCKILEMKIMGIPAKKHFKINGTELINLMQEITQQVVNSFDNKKSIHLTTRSKNTLQQVVNSFDNKKSNNLTTIYKEQNINNTYKEQKNNIKKDFDNLVIKSPATQQNVDNEPNIDRSQNAVFIEKNENNVDIVYNKTSDTQFINYNTGLPAIILDEPADVIVEKITNFTENDIVDSQPMVQQAYCEAGIAVFNDGQQGFGSLLNKHADLWLKSDILMQLRNYNKNSQDKIIIICQEKKITYQQLYNVFYDTMYKKKQNILDTKKLLNLNYFITVLQSFNQLTSNQHDNNNIQGNTNNRGSSQQNEPSTERYITAGTKTNYGTGAEGLRAIHEAHYK